MSATYERGNSMSVGWIMVTGIVSLRPMDLGSLDWQDASRPAAAHSMASLLESSFIKFMLV